MKALNIWNLRPNLLNFIVTLLIEFKTFRVQNWHLWSICWFLWLEELDLVFLLTTTNWHICGWFGSFLRYVHVPVIHIYLFHCENITNYYYYSSDQLCPTFVFLLSWKQIQENGKCAEGMEQVKESYVWIFQKDKIGPNQIDIFKDLLLQNWRSQPGCSSSSGHRW